jgi:hypothetical protein
MEEIRKKEQEWKVKRQSFIKFGQLKEANEVEQSKETMRQLETKLIETSDKQRSLIQEKVSRVQEHNSEVVEKK